MPTEEERAAAYREQVKRRALNEVLQARALAGDRTLRKLLEEKFRPLRRVR